jgi:hypothetical protein
MGHAQEPVVEIRGRHRQVTAHFQSANAKVPLHSLDGMNRAKISQRHLFNQIDAETDRDPNRKFRAVPFDLTRAPAGVHVFNS